MRMQGPPEGEWFLGPPSQDFWGPDLSFLTLHNAVVLPHNQELGPWFLSISQHLALSRLGKGSPPKDGIILLPSVPAACPPQKPTLPLLGGEGARVGPG